METKESVRLRRPPIQYYFISRALTMDHSLSVSVPHPTNQPTNHPLVAHTPPESDRALIFNDTCFRREREEWCGRRLTLVAGLV